MKKGTFLSMFWLLLALTLTPRLAHSTIYLGDDFIAPRSGVIIVSYDAWASGYAHTENNVKAHYYYEAWSYLFVQNVTDGEMYDVQELLATNDAFGANLSESIYNRMNVRRDIYVDKGDHIIAWVTSQVGISVSEDAYVSLEVFDNFNGVTIPESSTMLLLASGLIGLAGYGRKRLFKK